jgi:glycosyltransferase involved in cell wall biosynthesis
MTVSWCLLTFNRLETVKKSTQHNLINSGYPIEEIVWCDNASIDGTTEWVQKNLSPDVCILNKRNSGADPGYNRCLQLARSEWCVITGCDCLMPKDWLKTLMEHAEAIPNTGVISCYCVSTKEVPYRLCGPKHTINGKEIIPAYPMGRRFIRRSLLREIGFHREDMGLYGWADVLWGDRAKMVCDKMGYLCYTMEGFIAEHLTHLGPVGEFETNDAYSAWKQKNAFNDEKNRQCDEYRKAGLPIYIP